MDVMVSWACLAGIERHESEPWRIVQPEIPYGKYRRPEVRVQHLAVNTLLQCLPSLETECSWVFGPAGQVVSLPVARATIWTAVAELPFIVCTLALAMWSGLKPCSKTCILVSSWCLTTAPSSVRKIP